MSFRFSTGDSVNGTYPEGGSKSKKMANRRISRTPSQKYGTPKATDENIPMTVSIVVPRRSAASMPAGIPKTRAMISERALNSSETGKRSSSMTETRSLL